MEEGHKHIPCEECPCWRKYFKEDWVTPHYVEKADKEGKPMIDSDGNPVILKGPKGEKLSWGCCAAKLPEHGPGSATHVTMRSDWWCEAEEKYQAIRRLKEGVGHEKIEGVST